MLRVARASIHLFTFVIASSIAITGCDKSGIHPLGVPRDTVQAATTPTSTWLRSSDTGTEILLVGVATHGALPTEPTNDPDGMLFAHAFVAHDSSTTLDLGTYTIDATGAGVFTYDRHYQFVYQPNDSILQRKGASRTDLSPPSTATLAIAADGATLLVTIDGTQHRYTRLGDVIRGIDPSTDEGAIALYDVFNLPMLVSASRIVGFGGAGMTQYIAAPGEFAGMVGGQCSVSVESLAMPTVHITYGPLDPKSDESFEDLTGIVISDEQITYANLSGAGTMGGTLKWTMFGDAPGEILRSGTTDYANLKIANGLGGGGYYAFTVDGFPTKQVPYTVANDVDLRGVLPVVQP